MHKKSILFILTVSLIFMAAKRSTEFSYKTHGNVANYFESEQDFRTFFDFHTGDIVAEIGAGNGNNLRGFNAVADGVVFYLQDIDANTLSPKTFNKAIKLGENAFRNTFHRVIGTESQTNLPDNTFDKIFLISTFHEFSNMDVMMGDIHKKLKPNGRLYILESHCYTASHKNMEVGETISILDKNKFGLVKIEEKDINNSKGLYRTIFRKI